MGGGFAVHLAIQPSLAAVAAKRKRLVTHESSSPHKTPKNLFCRDLTNVKSLHHRVGAFAFGNNGEVEPEGA